jgi:hypothetical protein
MVYTTSSDHNRPARLAFPGVVLTTRGVTSGHCSILGSWTRCLLVAALCAAGCGRGYVLPVGDGITPYSPAALQGRIAEIAPDRLMITLDSSGMTTVLTPAETKFFRATGGLVLRQELVVGQRVRVWFPTPSAEKAGDPPTAAVVMLASLDPADDWPE